MKLTLKERINIAHGEQVPIEGFPALYDETRDPILMAEPCKYAPANYTVKHLALEEVMYSDDYKAPTALCGRNIVYYESTSVLSEDPVTHSICDKCIYEAQKIQGLPIKKL